MSIHPPPVAPYRPLDPYQSVPSRRVRSARASLILSSAAFTAAGVAVVVSIAASHTEPPAPASVPGPTAAEVQAQTVDLCTSWVAGYAALPDRQTSAADVVPSVSYMADALQANPAADGTIRQAVSDELRLARQQAAALSKEPAAGAIQPGTWTQGDADAANDAATAVLNLCRSYQP